MAGAMFGKTSSPLIVIAYAPCVTDRADRVSLRNQLYTAHASQNAEAADTRPEQSAVIRNALEAAPSRIGSIGKIRGNQ
jgi:hypothetical protein